MTLLQRATNTAVTLAWEMITHSSSSAGYTVQGGKGATGARLPIASTLSDIAKGVFNKFLDNVKSVASFYLEDLTTQLMCTTVYSKLNEIEWADERLWEIRIDGLPKPFTGFCPAQSAVLYEIEVDIGTQTIGNTSWQYIKGQGTRRISIDFLDDVTGSMEEFLYSWMDEISGQKVTGVTPIQKAGKVIQFRKLSRGKFVVSQLDLLCVPSGGLRYDNTQSSSSPRRISVDFAIIGINRRKVAEVPASRDMALVAATATANLARRNKYKYQVNRALNIIGQLRQGVI